MKVAALSISRGGVPKLPVMSARVTALGLAGDLHTNKKLHGGPDKAVCLFSLDVIAALRDEGHPITPGATGENVTLAGVPWHELAAGDVLELGDVIVQLTTMTDPCKKIAAAFADGNAWNIVAPTRTRWYARVLVEGDLAVGAEVRRRLRPAVPAP